MTITVEIPPETGAKLLVLAKSRGLTLDAFVKTIIADQAAATETSKPDNSLLSRGEESDRAIDDLFDTILVPPGVGEGAMRRENWYR
jgi:hypothetical protein